MTNPDRLTPEQFEELRNSIGALTTGIERLADQLERFFGGSVDISDN